eukprot:CAMPEP_0177744098 /NCGR_PEP_ID=MMETSP0484_2-20121128/29550_1 /TAXON_ID=354590 /ORGANISM="Rhodomonas lens, Strain RHODO" /LENGTH=225 /DNA_ID=CAMNT_0019258549 /DNA_START=195 /DNA_END=869 /DNA_ORIENTATION=+
MPLERRNRLLVVLLLGCALGAHAATETSGNVKLKDVGGRHPFVSSADAEIMVRAIVPKSHDHRRAFSSDADAKKLQQVVVRVNHPAPTNMMEMLKRVSATGFVQYFPHDTYITVLDATGLSDVSTLPGVAGVFEMPHAMKRGLDTETPAKRDEEKESDASLRNHMGPTVIPAAAEPSKVTIDVLLALLPHTTGMFDFAGLQHDLRQPNIGGSQAVARWPSFRKLT